jgi:hypothetical protein
LRKNPLVLHAHFEGVLHANALTLLHGTNPAGIANNFKDLIGIMPENRGVRRVLKSPVISARPNLYQTRLTHGYTTALANRRARMRSRSRFWGMTSTVESSCRAARSAACSSCRSNLLSCGRRLGETANQRSPEQYIEKISGKARVMFRNVSGTRRNRHHAPGRSAHL